MSKFGKIAILTSGGDAPGMNAAIRAAVRTAKELGMDITGVRSGYRGLIDEDFEELELRSVSGIIQSGGTVLRTSRCEEMYSDEGIERAVKNAKKAGIEGLIVIGGDGSFRAAQKLSEAGLPTVGLPGTIDNDIACTDYTIGFDTACNIAIQAIDRLRDTSESHNRCCVVEVMGHRAGYLAVNTAVASGAIAVLVPERQCDYEAEIFSRIRAADKKWYIVVVAEGYRESSAKVASKIERGTGMETRLTVLGHIQRGGPPTVLDRVNATRMAYRAADLLSKGIGSRAVAIKSDVLTDYDIQEALAMKKQLNEKLLEVCRVVSM